MERPARALATSRLRMWGYAAILTALCFAQSAGRMVADTKFDLVTEPGQVPDRRRCTCGTPRPRSASCRTRPTATRGRWGRSSGSGDLVHLPPWVIQRLWWSLLLVPGVLRHRPAGPAAGPRLAHHPGAWPASRSCSRPGSPPCWAGSRSRCGRWRWRRGCCCRWSRAQRARVGPPGGRAERARRGHLRRSERRRGGRGAPARRDLDPDPGGGAAEVAAAGLVDAVHRPGDRSGGSGRCWCSGATARRSSTTSRTPPSPPIPTGLARTLLGTSDWVAYFAGIDYPAGQHLVTTPFLMLDAAGVVALGPGRACALRGNPHQRFLDAGAAGRRRAGRVRLLRRPRRLVGRGPHRAARRRARAVPQPPQVRRRAAHPAGARAGARARACCPRCCAAPARPYGAARWSRPRPSSRWSRWRCRGPRTRSRPRGGVAAVPGYWRDAADYLAEQDDDGSVALELPAAAFGVYDWGNVHDDVMQGLADSPWAVRNVIPLAQPGNVVFLDAVTRVVESGHPSDTLAPYLAANGVGRLVVRNDLDRFQTGAPDPAYVRSVLTRLAGHHGWRGRSDPRSGSRPCELRLRTAAPGWSAAAASRGRTGSIDVYDVDARRPAHGSPPAPRSLVGDPAAGLRPGLAGPAQRVAGRGRARATSTGQVLTDGARAPGDELRRRALEPSRPRWPADEPYRLSRARAHPPLPRRPRALADHRGRGPARQRRSRRAAPRRTPTRCPPLQIGAHPGAALDGDPATAWRSARQLDPTGQWWQVALRRRRRTSPRSRSRSARDSARRAAAGAPVRRRTRGSSTAPDPGESRTYPLGLHRRPSSLRDHGGRTRPAAPRLVRRSPRCGARRARPSATCSCRCPTTGSRSTRSSLAA